MPTNKKYLKKKSLRTRKTNKTRKHRKTYKKRNAIMKRRNQRKHSKKMFGSGNIIDRLSDNEIEEILDNFGSNMDESKRSEARELLRRLKFDPTYTEDCFFSKLPKHRGDNLTLREQAESKVQCWFKYGDKIE